MQTFIEINKPVLVDFFRYLFPERENNFIKISALKDIGKFLLARVSYSDLPAIPTIDNPVYIKLPSHINIITKKKFCYYTKEDTVKINYELEATFNIDFDRYYLEGKKLNFNQKDIISSYILSRDLDSYEGDLDTLKKRKYREEVKRMGILQKHFINKCKYRNNLIENSISK